MCVAQDGGWTDFRKILATTAYRKACRIISLSSPVKFCRPIPCKAKVSWGEGDDLTVPIEMRYSVDFLWNKRLGEYNRKKEERGKVNGRSWGVNLGVFCGRGTIHMGRWGI